MSAERNNEMSVWVETEHILEGIRAEVLVASRKSRRNGYCCSPLLSVLNSDVVGGVFGDDRGRWPEAGPLIAADRPCVQGRLKRYLI
jgi:hypothetical protein